MEIRPAAPELPAVVRAITQSTIDAVYPRYYPPGAVDFFKSLHSDEAVRGDAEKGLVYLLFAEGTPVGTVTIRENRILR